MSKRNFYPIEQAAAMLKPPRTTEDLLHSAAWNYDGQAIPIYILTAAFFVHKVHVDKAGQADEHPAIPLKILQLEKQCLQEYEAVNFQGDLVDVAIQRKPYDDPTDGYWHYRLKRKDVIYPSFDDLRRASQSGVDIDLIYPEPIKIRECKMVVLAEDLERFQSADIEPSKPNGHEERHAKNREEVLGAALAVMTAWPEKCRFNNGKINASAIADLIIEKSYNFWRETGEPPLKKDGITRLVSDWINKIKI